MMKRLVAISTVLIGATLAAVALAQSSGGPLTGWAWNSPSIGWISLSSTNAQTGPGGAYGITIPPSDGPVTGYAWSSNVGWINFNAVSGCPTSPCGAQRAGDAIQGWAQIVSIKDAGVNSGGWDGWIKLSGTATNNAPYGVKINSANGAVTGDAWSPEIGWIKFGGTTPTIPPSGGGGNSSGYYPDGPPSSPPPAPGTPTTEINAKKTGEDDSALANPLTVLENTPVTVVWTSTNTTNCEVKKTILGNSSITISNTANGSIDLGPTSQPTIVDLSCDDIANGSALPVVSVNIFITSTPVPPGEEPTTLECKAFPNPTYLSNGGHATWKVTSMTNATEPYVFVWSGDTGTITGSPSGGQILSTYTTTGLKNVGVSVNGSSVFNCTPLNVKQFDWGENIPFF